MAGKARSLRNTVSPVKVPSIYVFNREVPLDLFDTHDDKLNVSVWLKIVCDGTT